MLKYGLKGSDKTSPASGFGDAADSLLERGAGSSVGCSISPGAWHADGLIQVMQRRYCHGLVQGCLRRADGRFANQPAYVAISGLFDRAPEDTFCVYLIHPSSMTPQLVSSARSI